MFKKIIFCIIIAAFLNTTVFATTTSLTFNGTTIETKNVIESNGVTFVPLDAFSNCIGAQYLYSPQEDSFAIMQGTIILFMMTNQKYIAIIDSSKVDISTFDINKDINKIDLVELSVYPQKKNGMVVIPLRDVCNVLGYELTKVGSNITLIKKVPTLNNTNVTQSISNNKDSIRKYLTMYYSVCKTDIGDIEMKFTVSENTSRYSPYDYCIDIDLDAKSYYELQYGKNVSSSTSTKVKSQLKSHMENMAKDLCLKLPQVKFNGYYDESYYEYPNLRMDYHLIRFCSWKNYTGRFDTQYSDAKISTFTWDTEFDEEIW